jgi:hypothetical protein
MDLKKHKLVIASRRDALNPRASCYIFFLDPRIFGRHEGKKKKRRRQWN